MRAWSLPLVVSLAAAHGLAQPVASVLQHPDPPFAITVPAGFEAFASERPPAGLVGCFRRFTAGPSQPPTVLLVALMGEEVPQRALRASELVALRRGDPPTLRFNDRPAHVRALGFELDALQGDAAEGPMRAVRIATAVPIEGERGPDAVLLTVLAPAARQVEAQRVFSVVASSMRAQSSWRTPAERARIASQQLSGALAFVLSFAYLIGAVALWRRRPRWVSARRRWLAVMGLAWGVYAVGYLVARHERAWGHAVQAALLAVASFWQARNLRRE